MPPRHVNVEQVFDDEIGGGVWMGRGRSWQHPDRRQYYFGHLDAGRVAFTMGRDLVMKPPQHGAPINFLIYPYVEVDGKPLPQTNAKNQFEYTDIYTQSDRDARIHPHPGSIKSRHGKEPCSQKPLKFAFAKRPEAVLTRIEISKWKFRLNCAGGDRSSIAY